MKEEILKTALNQFVHTGIREMSVQKLVSQLSISTKTFYKYFKNKEELLEEALRLHYDLQYIELEKQADEKNPVILFYEIWQQATLKEYNVNNRFFADLNYYYPALQQKIERETGDRFWERLKQIIDKGIAEGYFKNEIDPYIVLESIAVLLNSISRTDQFLKYKTPAEEIFNNSIAILIKGFCTQAGLEVLETKRKND
ncbi:MAG: TetR/AcrR family transcriptional regulator [Draconibacterium sp.]